MWWEKRRLRLTAIFADEIQERVLSDLRQFFGPGPEPYLNIYEQMRQAKAMNKTWGWSWPAFLLGFVWFFYRKMFLLGAVMVLAPLVFGLLFGRTGVGGVELALAALAKPIYVQRAISRIEKADALGLTGAERADYLKRAGGVSPLGGALAAVLFALFLAATIYRIITK